MEGNGLGGGLFSSIGPGMIGLELPIQQQQNPHHLNHPHVVVGSYDHPQSSQPSSLKLGGYSNKSKQAAISDDEEPGDEGGDGKRKMSQWQRMKWTDTMVRLLIMAVFYIGDEGGPDGTADPAKKNSHKPSGVVLQQKKGKWKSVSRAMLEKGFYVSPQQCEDKFNDLNKRYKRVNDILGRGTACRVVENQSLLESMDLAPRVKEEVRRLLNSKHLFFREMCAYHNSCGHASAGPHQSPELPSEPNKQQQPCLHSTDNNNNNNERAVSKGVDEEEEDEEEEEEEEEDDESEEDYYDNENEDDHDEPRKRAKKTSSSSQQMIRRFGSEVAGVVEDGTKSAWEKKQWLRARMVELEEEQVGYRYEAFELEKQRLKWAKFSSKKEREMEKAKFENEKKRLENERKVLLVRQKELQLLDLSRQHHSSSTKRNADPSSITA